MENAFIKKRQRTSEGASVTQKYEFIDAEYASPPVNAPAPAIVQMCRWLDVSKSGFYEWRSRPESATARRHALLKIKIEALFHASDETYGYRRMHQALVRGGEQVGEELVRKLMRKLGLEPCQPKPWRHSLTEQGPSGPIPDPVNRDFTAGKPGEKMIGDITYIPTWEGWVYLALVIDCATRMIIGWAMGDNYKTPLITSAITMAARNVKLPDEAVFRSDRGSNYTSAEYAKDLKELRIRQSVGHTGICYDNAMAESVNGVLKVELVHRKLYATRRQAMDDIADGSNSAIIRYVFIQHSDTGPRELLGMETAA